MLIQICSVEHPNLVLTANGHDDHSTITLRLDQNLPNQIWKMEKESSHWYSFRLSKHDSKCLDYDKSNHNLQIYRKHILNDDNQKWKVVEEGEFRFIESKSGEGMVITCAERGLGTPLEVRQNLGARIQKFTIKQVMG